MKELILNKQGFILNEAEALTNKPQKKYSRGEDKFMSDGPVNSEGSTMSPENGQNFAGQENVNSREETPEKLPPNADNSGGSGGKEPPKEPPIVGAAGNQQPEFKDVRLEDIKNEIVSVLGEGKGAEPEFINEIERRINNILDEKDFTNESDRRQANGLKQSLISSRKVSSEGQVAFKQQLSRVKTNEEFSGMKTFFAEASGFQFKTYEQLEAAQRRLGDAFGQDAAKITQDFRDQVEAMRSKIQRQAMEKGEPPRDLSDEERIKLGKAYQDRRGELLNARKSVRESLERNFGSARRTLTADQQSLISQIAEKEKEIAALDSEKNAFEIRELRKGLRDLVLELSQPLSPENEPLPDEILKVIGKDAFATEEFMDRLTRLPQEGKPYHLPGFYSDINLVKFLRLNEDLMSKKDLDHVSNVVAATEVIHEMNRILRTNIDQFAQISQSILASHLTTLFQVPGVQDVYELYDEIIKENQSIEMVFSEGVYDAIDEQVEKEFTARREKKIKREGKDDYLVRSFAGEGRMEDWEKKRALIFGRNLIRTTFREPEHISISSLPQASDGDARSKFMSYAQNQLLNVFNPETFTTLKFEPGVSQGGVEMLKEHQKREQDKRRHGRNYHKDEENHEETGGIVGLKVVQGAEVKNIESTVDVATRGLMMTWRDSDAGLLEFAMMDNGKPSNVKQFFTDHAREISLLGDIDSKNRWKAEFKRTKGVITDDYTKTSKSYGNFENWKRARVEQVFGPLFNENAVALGSLVSSAGIPMPTIAKKMLWERIADLNPDTMASILTRLEVDREAKGAADRLKDVKSLEEILFDNNFGTSDQRKDLRGPNGEWRPRLVRAEMGKLDEEYRDFHGKMKRFEELKSEKDISYWTQKVTEKGKECDSKRLELRELENQVKGLLRCEKWTTLRGKLRTIHALRMEDEVNRIKTIKSLKPGDKTIVDSPKMTLDGYFSDPRLSAEDMITAEDELAVISAISVNGKEISQDIANIKRAHIWFLEDTPTALMKWENLGQSFYRMITDFAQMNQTATEMNAWLENPFMMEPQKALEHLAKMIHGSGSVLGIEAAQNNLFSLIMVWNEWQRIEPQYRQKFIEMARSAMEKYLSPAQKVSRDTGAGAWDEDAAHAQLLTQNHLSIMRREERDTKTKEILQTGLFEKADRMLQCGLFDRVVKSKARDWLIFFFLGMIVQLFKETASAKSR